MINIDDFYNHQKDYYGKLLIQQKPFHSLICIPTGGGKTKLAVTYAINMVLNKGKKVLWITHSQYLLNQAYEVFRNLKNDDDWMKQKSILIHSNAHNSNEISSNHCLIIASFQSLIRSKKDWKSTIGDNVCIIIDEAHHIVAESYMNLIKDYSVGKNIIGLSATPIRSKKNESNKLYKFFETDLGIKVHITSLFKEKILVHPLFEEVIFSFDDSEVHTLDELCDGLCRQSDNYNSLIFNQYKDNENKYGKTVIFALNIDHVNSLYQLFATNGYKDKVYRVYSGLDNREQQFIDFSNSKDGILINVNIMNEGVDVPDIQSVFLTKPLNSKVAVTQIIGRALRKSQNTSKNCAYIVNFAVSNLGKKVLLVTPRLSYKMYEAEWNEDREKISIIESEEKSIDAIAELMQEVIKKKANCSFSNVCLAGHFTLINSENMDLPFPVSYKEYKKIKLYIESFKRGKNIKFPNKLFFCDNVDEIRILVDENIINNGEIVFTKYDDDLFTEMDYLSSLIRTIFQNVKMTIKERDSRIIQLFESLSPNMKYYLNQIGANTESSFKLLVRNEFVLVKYEGDE